MSSRSRTKPFKACRACRALVDKGVEVCPNCGSKDFSEEWDGVVIVIEPESSEVAKSLDIKLRGRFVAKLD